MSYVSFEVRSTSVVASPIVVSLIAIREEVSIVYRPCYLVLLLISLNSLVVLVNSAELEFYRFICGDSPECLEDILEVSVVNIGI